jgi:hypothetical protein
VKPFTFLVVLLWILITGCTRENENCKSDLTISSVNTPSSGTVSSGITSAIQCHGSNLCYSFSHVEIKEKTGRIFEIRVKANVPCKPSYCLQAIYNANPSIKINTSTVGTYILNFYNGNALFKSDTVIIN